MKSGTGIVLFWVVVKLSFCPYQLLNIIAWTETECNHWRFLEFCVTSILSCNFIGTRGVLVELSGMTSSARTGRGRILDSHRRVTKIDFWVGWTVSPTGRAVRKRGRRVWTSVEGDTDGETGEWNEDTGAGRLVVRRGGDVQKLDWIRSSGPCLLRKGNRKYDL